MDPDQEARAPTRAELAREAYEDWLATTYEARFAEFCTTYGYDPEEVEAVLAYEEHWEVISEEDMYGGHPH